MTTWCRYWRAFSQELKDLVPYYVAEAELVEGVRLTGSLSLPDGVEPAAGMRVNTRLVALDPDLHRPEFVPAKEGTA